MLDAIVLMRTVPPKYYEIMEEKVQVNDRELACEFLVHLTKWKN
jgi:hypothetical protein